MDVRKIGDLTVDEFLALIRPAPAATEWIRVSRAAKQLGIARSTLFKQATSGALPPHAFKVMPNQEIRYSQTWVDQQVARVA